MGKWNGEDEKMRMEKVGSYVVRSLSIAIIELVEMSKRPEWEGGNGEVVKVEVNEVIEVTFSGR